MSPRQSTDPRKRARQRSNLRQGPAAPKGNQLARSHGGYAVVTARERDEKAREVFAALSADAPLRGPDGGLPAADTAVVSLFSRCLVQLERVEQDMADHGWRDRKTGEPRPVVDLARRLRAEALDYAESLGMTPRSRARLGLDLQRSFDLAAFWSEQDQADGAGDA